MNTPQPSSNQNSSAFHIGAIKKGVLQNFKSLILERVRSDSMTTDSEGDRVMDSGSSVSSTRKHRDFHSPGGKNLHNLWMDQQEQNLQGGSSSKFLDK
jgi:hypothetical protein